MGNRFETHDDRVSDLRTGLMWSRNAALTEFPMTWKEAFDFVQTLNQQRFQGHADWRLPNRRELFSIVSHTLINPALPADHPFDNVFHGYYWTATTCARLPDQAWYIHMGGARVYRGMKYVSYMVWPVRSQTRTPGTLVRTGQKLCFDETGKPENCGSTPQAASVHAGAAWPEPRFEAGDSVVRDAATGLSWLRCANISRSPISWQAALDLVRQMNRDAFQGFSDWRLPNVRELESLVDSGAHSPALAAKDLFEDVRDFYWSATTSQYEIRYAWALYLKDGAVGVGFKQNPEFFLWPVRGECQIKID